MDGERNESHFASITAHYLSWLTYFSMPMGFEYMSVACCQPVMVFLLSLLQVVFMRTLAGKKWSFPFLEKKTTVANIKSGIKEWIGLGLEEQCLIFDGKELTNVADELHLYNIKDQSILYLVHHLKSSAQIKQMYKVFHYITTRSKAYKQAKQAKQKKQTWEEKLKCKKW